MHVDRLKRLQLVAPRAVNVVPEVLVVQPQQGGSVSTLGRIESPGEVGPERVAVHRLGNGCERDAPGDLWSSFDARDRVGIELQHQFVECPFGVAVVVECAAGIGAALGKICRQRLLEALALAQPCLQLFGVRVGCTVEDGGPHRRWEQRRPRSAELGSVAPAEVADFLLAERPAERINVSRRIVGADELDDVGIVRRARLGELQSEVDDLLTLRIVIGGDVGAGVEVVVVVDAVDRRFRQAGATRVEPDDVEGVGQLVSEQLIGVGDEVAPTEAGTTGVDDQRAHRGAGVVRDTPHDMDPEHGPVRVGIVDRHLEKALLETWPDLRPHDFVGFPERVVSRAARRGIDVSGTDISPVPTATALAA